MGTLRGRSAASLFIAALLLFSLPLGAAAEPRLAPELRQKIDDAVRSVLASTGVPSSSVAVVKDGQIAYLNAYGEARLEPRTAARADMRYSVGSISKQFTAAAILMLAEQGKLSLDDPVAKFVPDLTRAREVTLRQLLSHTSGYQDYWPQDYVPPFMLETITARRIMDLWARKPLDFEPGAKWQYSNTNYVIAGVVIEKASGMPMMHFLRKQIFAPLGMKSVLDIDQQRLTETDATGYMRYGLGPLRVAPKEGAGWLFATGELAMTAEDLAKWDIALMQRRLMKPASYEKLETEIRLANGLGTRYALGLSVNSEGGRRVLEHGGEVSGFTAQNVVYPEERTAIVVLANQDAIGATGDMARKIAAILFDSEVPAAARKLQQARNIFEGLQRGQIDRSLFTPNANAYFSEQAVKDFATGLAPLGAPLEFRQTAQRLRGGMTLRRYRARFPNQWLTVWTYEMPDGKLEQYQVAPAE